MQDRQNKILEMLIANNKLEVSRLAETLGVSQVTIRKDLAALENKGIVKREHGYATLSDVDDLSSRLAWHYDLKEQIAKKAIEDVQDGETIMIESGSCCALVALALVQERKDITIITNSAFIADFIRKESTGHIILLGGEYQKESQCNVGPITRKCAQTFFVDKFFIGTDGFLEKSGFTGKDYMRSETVRDMSEQANKVIVVTESSKFFQQGTVNLIDTKKVSHVITDDGIPKDIKNYLEEQNIQVKIAD